MLPFCFDCLVIDDPTTASSMAGYGYRGLFGLYSKTPYELHKDAWVKTGDIDELNRMTRHVTWTSA